MTAKNIIDSIGFDRAKLVSSKHETLLESESVVLDQIQKFEFNVDALYFNYDENGNIFHAVFLKKIKSFDRKTLEKLLRYTIKFEL